MTFQEQQREMIIILVALAVLALAQNSNANPGIASVIASDLPSNPVQNYAWFNNGTSYVQLDAGLNSHLNNGFTIEVWAYNENPNGPNFQPIVAHADQDAADLFHTDFVLQVNANNGRVTFVMGAGPDTYGFQLQGQTLPFNQWTHIAVSVQQPAGGNPSAARMYMNGNLVASADQWGGGAQSRQITSNGVTIGYVNLGGQPAYWIGELDEVRFWDTVRSQAQIQQYMRDPFLFDDPAVIPADLVAYYSFDAGPDSAVWDNAAQPYYDGVPYNGQTRVVAPDVVNIPLSPLLAPLAGPPSFGLEFTGAYAGQNAVTLPNELSRVLPRGFTFEAWVYMEAPSLANQHYKTIAARWTQSVAAMQPGTFAAGSNPESDFVFQVDPRNGRLVFFMGGGRGACETNSLGYGVALFSSGQYNLQAYTWTHVAFSVIATQTAENPFEAKLYMNGQLVPQAPELPGNTWSKYCTRNYLRFDPVRIGYYNNGIEQYWEGRIDEVRIWSEPVDDADIAANYIRPLTGTEPNLLAYYPIDEGAGVTIYDETPHALNGMAMAPMWVPSQGPTEMIDGVSGFPVPIVLQASSPPMAAQNDTYTYVITELPSNGGIFTTGTPIALIDNSTVANNLPVPSQLTYVSNIGFTGYDTIGYAAIANSTGLMSATHYIVFSISPYSPTGGNCVPDVCGVCNGDGTSCVGGCDGKGGVVDVCGVCGGLGASCTCVYYKTFQTDELDCVLFENQVNRTIARIENSITTLFRTLMALETFDQESWRDNFVNLGIPLSFLCNFNNGCLKPFEASLTEFESTINGTLTQCSEPAMM